MSKREPRPVRAEELSTYLSESRGLERDYIGEILRSRRAAWRVAGAMAGLAVLGAATGVAGLYQEPAPPLVLRVDNATGAVEQVTQMRVHEASYGEVVDTYWLNQYALNRESYDYNTIQLNYDTTALLSAADVQKDYYKLFDGPNARDRVLANKTRILVTVRSIQLNGRGQATIRFTTQQVHTNGVKDAPQHQIATVGYAYINAPMSTADRRINPLGFQVTSYRADPELGS